jgi:hypothetical protein
VSGARHGGPVTAGLDVAGPGEDETVLVLVEGSHVLALQAWTEADPRGAIAVALAPYRQRLEAVQVDAAGIGYYLGKHLEDLDYPVRLVNVGESSSQSDRYRNLKAEFYWSLRLRFQRGAVAGLRDERAIGQLAGILYRHTSRGQVEIETKAEARKRGVKSPDRAEAVMLAFARAATVQMLWSEPLSPQSSGTAARAGSYTAQLREGLRDLIGEGVEEDEQLTCATCSSFDRIRGWCTLRLFRVEPSLLACNSYDADLD